MKLIKPLFLFILCLPLLSLAQLSQPKESAIYFDTDVPRIDITIAQIDLDYLLNPENEDNDEEFPATFKFASGSFNAIEENIGFRLRGNTSRSAEKKSFKVSINEYQKGRDLDGFEKFNLNGEHNDPSIIRSKLCWDLMNEIGVPSSRANLVELYINGDYYGVYANIEHVDEEFVEERFGNKDGNLFKCLYPADLKYKSSDPNVYKEEYWGRRAYELSTNEEIDDYTGLANLIRVLNQTSNSVFESEIEEVFDVLSYLKALAVEVLVAHWDNYGINQNNFYLYENPADGKFYYIPYDLDNTLGVDWFNVDWADWDIYEWYNDNRPLTRRILQVSKYREEFTRIMDRLLKDQFLPANINPRIDELKAMIQDAAERDQYRTYDYGFTIDDFNKSYTQSLDYFQVRYGLKEYIQRRHTTALSQLDDVIPLANTAITASFSIYPNPSKDVINITLPFEYTSAEVDLFTLDGKKILTKTFEQQNLRIQHDLPEGVYLLQIRAASSAPINRKVYISD